MTEPVYWRLAWIGHHRNALLVGVPKQLMDWAIVGLPYIDTYARTLDFMHPSREHLPTLIRRAVQWRSIAEMR